MFVHECYQHKSNVSFIKQVICQLFYYLLLKNGNCLKRICSFSIIIKAVFNVLTKKEKYNQVDHSIHFIEFILYFIHLSIWLSCLMLRSKEKLIIFQYERRNILQMNFKSENMKNRTIIIQKIFSMNNVDVIKTKKVLFLNIN